MGEEGKHLAGLAPVEKAWLIPVRHDLFAGRGWERSWADWVLI